VARRRTRLARKQLRVLPYFIALLVTTGLLWLAAYAGTGFNGFPVPKLGLDLQGGMTMTLSARTPNGGTPEDDNMNLARQIIENRVNGTGVAEPDVYIEGKNNIVVNVAGKETKPEELRQIGAPAELRFREVLSGPAQDYSAQDPKDFEDDAEDAGKDDSGEEADSADSSGDSSGEDASKEPSDGASDKDEDKDQDKGDDPVELNPDLEKRREAVYEKLNKASEGIVDQATQVIEQQQGQPFPEEQLAAVMQMFAPFGELKPDEVAALPPDMQFFIPNIGCGQLNARTPGAISAIKEQVVACESPTPDQVAAAKEAKQPAPYSKYLMADARVVGEDVSTAAVQPDAKAPGKWAVGISFTGKGTDKWTKLASDTVNKKVAIVLDNEVVSAPNIEPGAANGGQVEISGTFTSDDARLLSEQLKYGSLPAVFTVETIDQVSPTLGISQMQAGLIAGGIGVALVILYCLVYYRVLGLVVIISLAASGAMLYPAIAMLGQQIGFTLTLAGIAGFIVAIGITADSFVVFFEFLKDEFKEGRSARSAVPRAWVRGRRTIMSADTVSMIAAVVLYFLAIGAVKGFAFTLGLSTLVDVAIVFLFTHPLVSWMSRFRILNSQALSGLHTSRARTVSTAGAARPKES
jgi:preprotein translocase subunit SecD